MELIVEVAWSGHQMVSVGQWWELWNGVVVVVVERGVGVMQGRWCIEVVVTTLFG